MIVGLSFNNISDHNLPEIQFLVILSMEDNKPSPISTAFFLCELYNQLNKQAFFLFIRTFHKLIALISLLFIISINFYQKGIKL